MKPPFLIALLLIAATATAAPEPKELVRDPASDYDGACRYVEVDGKLRRRCAIRIPNPVGTFKLRINVSINEEAGTFSFKKGETPAWLEEWIHEEPLAEDETDEIRHRDETTREKTTPGNLPEPHGDGCPCEGMECVGSINVWMYTRYVRPGQPQSNLTKTTVIGGWKRYVTNLESCRWVGLPATYGCVGAHPSSQATNWYTDILAGCVKDGPHVTSGPQGIPGRWQMSATGHFNNWDFGDPLKPTFAKNMVWPIYDSGEFWVDVDDGFDGEYQQLSFPVDLSLNNTCHG